MSQLQLSNKILLEIMEALSSAIYIADKNGELIYLNDAAKEMDHLSEKDDIGKNLTKVYSNTDLTSDKKSPTLDTIQTGIPHIRENLEWYLQDGTRVNAITSTYPITEKGKIIGAYAISENVDKIREFLVHYGNFQKKLAYRLKNKSLKNGTQYVFNDIIGESELINNTITVARRFAAKKLPVMIYGETGTGKELFAQSIHNASPYVSGPFVPINCAAIPETLLESMLFGTKKGAFTGAIDSPGLFEKAEGGSIFLDEINSMPLLLQAKLLRALQEKEVQRIGDTKIRPINCRIISATNKLPSEAIRNNELREDLYYRLATGMIWIPSLHERSDDIDILVNHFINKCNAEVDTTIISVSTELRQLLHSYLWPGNVRELSNVIESAINMTGDGETILDICHLPTYMKQFFSEELSSNPKAQEIFSMRNEEQKKDTHQIRIYSDINTMVDDYEKEIILFTLSSVGGNISRCGEKLGISRQSMAVKIKKYHIDPEKYKRNSAKG